MRRGPRLDPGGFSRGRRAWRRCAGSSGRLRLAARGVRGVHCRATAPGVISLTAGAHETNSRSAHAQTFTNPADGADGPHRRLPLERSAGHRPAGQRADDCGDPEPERRPGRLRPLRSRRRAGPRIWRRFQATGLDIRRRTERLCREREPRVRARARRAAGRFKTPRTQKLPDSSARASRFRSAACRGATPPPRALPETAAQGSWPRKASRRGSAPATRWASTRAGRTASSCSTPRAT